MPNNAWLRIGTITFDLFETMEKQYKHPYQISIQNFSDFLKILTSHVESFSTKYICSCLYKISFFVKDFLGIDLLLSLHQIDHMLTIATLTGASPCIIRYEKMLKIEPIFIAIIDVTQSILLQSRDVCYCFRVDVKYFKISEKFRKEI